MENELTLKNDICNQIEEETQVKDSLFIFQCKDCDYCVMGSIYEETYLTALDHTAKNEGHTIKAIYGKENVV